MVKINLLPLKVRKTNVALRLYSYIIIGSSVSVIVLVLLLLNLMSQVKKIDNQIRELDAKQQELAPQVAPIKNVVLEEKATDQMKKLIYDLSLEQPVWITILDELADQVRKDVWLTGLKAQRDLQANALRIILEGEAYHKISVADFLSALENSDIFSNVKLEALNDNKQAQYTQVKFKLQFNYAGALQQAKGVQQ